FNAYLLRTAAAPWFDNGLTIHKTGEHYTLACTQIHQLVNDRRPVKAGTLEQYRKGADFAHMPEIATAETPAVRNETERLVPGSREGGHDKEPKDRRLRPLTLYPEFPYDGYKWGMAIDLSACVGCG